MRCNGESPLVDCQRNAPLTNAERQRRYRDHKRGGPPVGRWHDHVSVAAVAKSQGIGRSLLFMASWLQRFAPDLIPQLERGELKVTQAYYRRRDQLAMQAAMQGGRADAD